VYWTRALGSVLDHQTSVPVSGRSAQWSGRVNGPRKWASGMCALRFIHILNVYKVWSAEKREGCV